MLTIQDLKSKFESLRGIVELIDLEGGTIFFSNFVIHVSLLNEFPVITQAGMG